MNKELIEYVRARVDDDEVERAWEEIEKQRCPLSHVDSRLYDKIENSICDYCYDNDINMYGSDWEDYDVDYVFEQL